MSYVVNPKELEAVMRLAAVARYQYFLNKVADWGELWGVGRDDHWSMMESETVKTMPVWPAAAFAAECCIGIWEQDIPKPIACSTWREKWIPGLIADGLNVAVFPLPSNKGIVVTPKRLDDDLSESLAMLGE